MAATKKQLIERWKQEPGATIQRRIQEWCARQAAIATQASLRPGSAPPPADSASLYELLDGLPFRDEVPGGRDLRASVFPGARKLDLNDADLSYCQEIGMLDDCDPRNLRLDEARVLDSLRGRFDHCAFRRAKLRKVWMTQSTFARCDFTGADLRGAEMKGADLRGSIFRDANLQGADLQATDLRGCDFRGAKLDSAMLRGVTLDRTTDLRAASLTGAALEEHRDFSGKLVLAATDLRRATLDQSTKSDGAAGADDLLLLDVIARRARQERAHWGARVAAEADRLRKEVENDPQLRWLDALMSAVSPADRPAVEAFLQRATLDFGVPD
jgi:uncharacterized protein YjbI with pentapeptide repeats